MWLCATVKEKMCVAVVRGGPQGWIQQASVSFLLEFSCWPVSRNHELKLSIDIINEQTHEQELNKSTYLNV